jgi:2-hydroxy-6-oxonona-2,4-dienedioate hydrolase
VLFVHGVGNGGSSWASLAARLPGFSCLVLDRPGHGLSDTLGRSLDADGVSRFADALVIDLLDAVGVRSAHVVATSLGGYMALRSEAAHPDRIDRMVQLGCPVGATHVPLWTQLPMMMLGVLPPTEKRVRKLFRRIGSGRSLDEGRITQIDVDWFLALLRYTDTKRNERAMLRRVRSPNRLVLPDSMLGKMATPTSFLWGENDPFGGADTARRLIDRMPNAELEMLPGAGHAPWLDDPDHCAKTISRFLSH